MARGGEIESRADVDAYASTNQVRGTVDPYHGDDMLPYTPGVPGRYDVPDYVVIRPPETGGAIQDRWSKLVAPTRAVAHGYLWITLYWWRTAILLVTLAAVVLTWRLS